MADQASREIILWKLEYPSYGACEELEYRYQPDQKRFYGYHKYPDYHDGYHEQITIFPRKDLLEELETTRDACCEWVYRATKEELQEAIATLEEADGIEKDFFEL